VPPAVSALVRRVVDVAVPAGVGLFLGALILDPGSDDPDWLSLLGILAAGGSAAALVWRRSHPVQVMLATLVCGLVVALLAPSAIFPVGALFAMWSLSVARPPLVSLPALLGVLGLTATALSTELPDDVWFGMAVAVAIWALAEAVRGRRQAILEASRRAVGEEQARIARELHDVIAHSVSVIVVQAAAADDVFDTRPDQARAALRSIEAAGREALGELRQLLGAVSPAARGSGLGRLAELTEPLREAGLEVAVHRSLPARELPVGVDLSAYRIVQEALTNTLRHAHATRASVTIREVGGALELDVSDDGTGVGGPSVAGRGLAGMRERAAMLGGTLDAGPLPDGGFRVHARLPLEPAR
jgi:signal transduction histidine kinase